MSNTSPINEIKNKCSAIANEVIIGIAAPIGTNKDSFLEKLQTELKNKQYDVKIINLADSLLDITPIEIRKSLKTFIKMEVCSTYREKYIGATAALMIKAIQDERELIKNDKDDSKRIVYIIDQLKNPIEYKILNHVYGINYIQISLFSNEMKRVEILKGHFNNDNGIIEENNICISIKMHLKSLTKHFSSEYLKHKLKDIITSYKDDIEPNVVHNLMDKDSNEQKNNEKSNGQQLFELLHKSHYFINLDKIKETSNEIKKFVKMLFGDHKEYPTQDEFGMSLAYQASVRSNFPGRRQIGSAIISKHGEILSAASIRAPSQFSNTYLSDEIVVTEGYKNYKKKIKDWRNAIKNVEVEHKLEIDQFLNDSLDYHPCTHAEISSILDAAKMGISIRGATLYSTTFPCHLCAKDIITAGINRVVYLEAYPKSKNKELYPQLIAFDPCVRSETPSFEFFSGVGPKRFTYVYSLDNKQKTPDSTPPLLRYEHPDYYKCKEEDVVNYFEDNSTISKDKMKLLRQLLETPHKETCD